MQVAAPLASLALAMCACGSDETPVHCPGERPDLGDCFLGRNFAECGGSGEPLFACKFSPYTDCRWFVGGCVPDGFSVSTCPADDLCCHENRPFTADQLEGNSYNAAMVGWHLTGNGTLPWNRTDHMVVTVEVNPDVTAGSTNLTCAGWPESPENPCDDNYLSVIPENLLQIQLGDPGLHGTYTVIEVDAAATPAPTARACLWPYSDVVLSTCPGYETVDCADSGALVVSSLTTPESIVGTVSLLFPDGATIEGTFSAL